MFGMSRAVGKGCLNPKDIPILSDLIKSNPLRMGLSEEYAATRLDSCIRDGKTRGIWGCLSNSL